MLQDPGTVSAVPESGTLTLAGLAGGVLALGGWGEVGPAPHGPAIQSWRLLRSVGTQLTLNHAIAKICFAI